MIINIQYGAPGFWTAGASTELNTALQFMDRIFTNPVAITIDFGWSGVPAPWIPQNIGQPQYLPIPPGDLASNDPALIGSNGSFNCYNYTTVTADLLANANASGDSLQLEAANAALHYVPFNTNIHVIRPEAEALGIVGGDNNLDGYVGFSANANFSYTPGNTSGSQYDFFAAVVHEVTEEMGRLAFGGTGNLLGFSAQNLYTVLDMFRYDAAGEANASNNSGAQNSMPSAWFSVDGGNPYGAGQFSNSGASNNALQLPEYDLADWIPGDPPIYGNGDPIANDAFGSVSPGGIAPISEEDFAIMKALGWDTTVVTSADTVTVSAGQTLSGYYVLNGGVLWVDTGGVVSGTYYTNATAFNDNLPAPGTTSADGAGYGYIYGGTDVGATVAAGGWQRVESVASATNILNQGEQEVLSNGIALNPVIGTGGTQQLDSGGNSVSATLNFGGLQDILGTALFTFGDGQQIVESGGFAGTSRVENGGVENVYSGGATANTTIDSGGSEVVWIGGVANSTTVSSGGLETVSGTDSGAIIQRFGFEVVAHGGTADGVAVSSGGTQTVYDGGMANSTVVSNGGTQTVARFGSASGSIISQGGNETLHGSDTGATVSSGGTQTVGNFGSASYALLSGGIEDVDSGGITFGTTVDSGGQQVVSAGGAASSTQIFSGGNENVYGSAVTTYVLGGTQTIEDGGTGTGTDVISGIENVDSATALATLVGSGGELVVSSGGTASGTTINLKGTLVVSSGGVAGFTTVKSGGTELIEQGGVDSIAKVSGGSQYVNAGGAASGTVVGSGGVQIVSAGASATSAVFYSGGDQYVSAGGTAISTTIRGGIELVLGTASGTMLRGGRLVAGGGGTLEGSTTIFGGTLEVQPGAAINGPIDFAGPGTLQIDGTTMPTATIDGFAAHDVIRLAGVNFVPGGSAVVAGHTLQITENGSTYDLQLDPNANYANVTFTVFSESQPGTYVVLGPPPTTNDTTISSGETVSGLVVAAGATLTILPGGTADGTIIEDGGTVNVEGTANGTVVDDGGNLVVLAGGVTNGTIVEDPGLETISAGGVSIDATLDGGEQYIESGGTATGNSHNDTFVVYNAADTVIGQAGSTDTVYTAANFTLPTNVDTLFLEGPSAILGTGNDDAVDALFGNAGVASTLVAGSGADILYVTGTTGTTLTGGAGADTFAFPNAMGHDEVTNFGTAKDTLQFNASLFANFSAAMQSATQVGANTVFTIDANNSVALDNVTKSSLTASNFHFT